VKLRIERARQAAEVAGRDPDKLRISTVVNIIGVDTLAELEDVIEERAREQDIEPEEAKQRITEFNMPIGTWDQVYETLKDWQDVGFQRIYLPMWGKPWDRQRAEATFKGLSRYT
jgi:alkanesulfonate monooxygenase SsuD/methylene tetrahydromethanopterin reductase-like flavin-dependent oxidoreductase (luciferase family)